MKTHKRLHFSPFVFFRRHGVVFLVVIVLCALTYTSFANEGFIHALINLDPDVLSRKLDSYGAAAPALFVLLVIIEVVTAPIPPFILYTTAGFLFGSFWGGTLALLGNILGATIAFLFARHYGRRFIEKKIPKKQLKRFDHYSITYGGLAVFLLRVNPFTSSDIVSYIAGLTNMRYHALLIGTTVGLAPIVYTQTFIGNDILQANPLLSLAYIWISIAYLVAIVYGALYARKHAR